jgi:hypothetical protein
VLAHPELTSLKGIALEVDTKAIPLIVEEFGRLREEVNGKAKLSPSPSGGEGWDREKRGVPNIPRPGVPIALPHAMGHGGEGGGEGELADLYRSYARVVSGQQPLEDSDLAPLAESLDREGLSRYTTRYLPHELLRWGGDLEELFPAIWDMLNERGITVQDFVRFWFRKPGPVTDPYDFFHIKLERWEAFINEMAPDLLIEVAREVRTLRTLHAELNDEPARINPLLCKEGQGEVETSRRSTPPNLPLQRGGITVEG